MIRIEFTPEELCRLRHEVFRHPHPFVRCKMLALLLKSLPLPHSLICRICDITPNTLRSYFAQYQAGGLERLQELSFHRPQSALEQHRPRLEEILGEHPPATLKEARALIHKETGLFRGLTQVRRFLDRCGLKRRKTGSVPAKGDPATQAAYRREKLELKLEEARQGTRCVFFVDAAHFVLQLFLGFLWCLKRLFIKAAPGRQRFNVLGALNAVSHQLLMVTNQTYITAQSVCELLEKIARQAGGLPVTVFLDNARYQHCALVKERARALGVELEFLPPYSPNLNLIERLWKFVKKKCLYSRYHPDFAAFRTAILECLSRTDSTHKAELETLLTLKFQTLENAQSMAV